MCEVSGLIIKGQLIIKTAKGNIHIEIGNVELFVTNTLMYSLYWLSLCISYFPRSCLTVWSGCSVCCSGLCTHTVLHRV